MYGHDRATDPACVKRRTGYDITVADLSVLWKSILKTKTALSTMEEEIIETAQKFRELFPIMDMVDLLGQ